MVLLLLVLLLLVLLMMTDSEKTWKLHLVCLSLRDHVFLLQHKVNWFNSVVSWRDKQSQPATHALSSFNCR